MITFLKQKIEEKHEDKKDALCEYLSDRLSGWQPARSHKMVHASALTYPDAKFCPREYALLDIVERSQKDRFIGCAQAVAFAQGQSLHDMARREWFRDIAVGDWRCTHCGVTKKLSRYPKTACPSCGGTHYEYREIRFISEQTHADGGIDLIVDLGEPKHMTVEIKTIDKDAYKALKAPMAEHRLRTILYLWLVRDSNSPYKDVIDTDRAKILYISKAFGSKGEDGKISPFKEFDVEYNPETIKPYLEDAAKVKAFRDGKGIPAGVCPTSLVPRVKSCGCPKECWSGKYPATQGPVDVKL